LDLTNQQQEEIAKLEKEVKDRLEKILTDKQKKKLQELRPPGPGGPQGGDRPNRRGGPGGGPGGPPNADRPSDNKKTSSGAAIQWFATWESGLKEAERTGRPILLVSAAPHCAGVSGIW
jgi:hypothetical protein